jgi:hypothetical protein
MAGIAAATKYLERVVVFTLVLAACSGTTADRSNGRSVAVIEGKVTAGPTCPVERADHPCPLRLVIAKIEAAVGTRVVASTRSEADGSYRLELPIGSYTLTAVTGTAFPRCMPSQVDIVTVAPTDVDISCDTGIR